MPAALSLRPHCRPLRKPSTRGPGAGWGDPRDAQVPGPGARRPSVPISAGPNPPTVLLRATRAAWPTQIQAALGGRGPATASPSAGCGLPPRGPNRDTLASHTPLVLTASSYASSSRTCGCAWPTSGRALTFQHGPVPAKVSADPLHRGIFRNRLRGTGNVWVRGGRRHKDGQTSRGALSVPT